MRSNLDLRKPVDHHVRSFDIIDAFFFTEAFEMLKCTPIRIYPAADFSFLILNKFFIPIENTPLIF